MKQIQMLDCTLRDGAQANAGNFGERAIKDIIDNLMNAGIDIIECGFIKECEYKNGVSYFPQPSFAKQYMPQKNKDVEFAALMDFGRYDVEKLEECDGTTFDLIRVSFFEKDIAHVKEFLKTVQRKGYRVSIQPMDTFSYSKDNIMKIIDVANEIQPEALSMVDTYSLADTEDIDRVYGLYEKNLNKDIKIGFHSHNNQLNSFALAKHFMAISDSERRLIIDSSLYGMGRGGGNLNTELFAEYLNRSGIKSYNMKNILDMIDTYLVKFKEEYKWGYDLPMLYAGLYGVHVFTTRYLSEKNGVTSYDLKCMFEMLDDKKKKRYDYDYLDAIYDKYMAGKGECHNG